MSQNGLQETLLKTMDTIKTDPAKARTVFEATTRLEGGVCCTATVRDFPALTIDEPPALGGSDAGMNPVELVLAALGTCQEIMFAAYAAVMGIPLDEVSVDVTGKLDLHGLFALDDSVPAGFHAIDFTVNVKSPAEPAQIRQLTEMVQAHCPVLDIVTRPVATHGTTYHNGEKIYSSAAEPTP